MANKRERHIDNNQDEDYQCNPVKQEIPLVSIYFSDEHQMARGKKSFETISIHS